MVPPPTESPVPRNPWTWLIGPAHVVGYLVATAIWIVVLGVITAVYLLLDGGLAVAADPQGILSMGPVLTVLTLVQLVGMAAIAVVGAVFIPPLTFHDTARRVRLSFAFRRPALIALPVAVALGAVTGHFPSWLGDQLRNQLPTPYVNQMIGSGLAGGWMHASLTVLAVAVAAPVCEEIVFRGYLWSAMSRSAPLWVTWVVTSVVFTAYHLDPAQMLGVLPIAFVLGWTRWQTGSIWPAMVVHAVNNGLALAVEASLDDPAAWPTPPWLAGGGFVLTLVFCAALWATRDRNEPVLA